MNVAASCDSLQMQALPETTISRRRSCAKARSRRRQPAPRQPGRQLRGVEPREGPAEPDARGDDGCDLATSERDARRGRGGGCLYRPRRKLPRIGRPEREPGLQRRGELLRRWPCHPQGGGVTAVPTETGIVRHRAPGAAVELRLRSGHATALRHRHAPARPVAVVASPVLTAPTRPVFSGRQLFR
jgi:hypothetical protein